MRDLLNYGAYVDFVQSKINIGGITELFRPGFSKTIITQTQSQFSKFTLKLGFYTKPRFILFVIPPNKSNNNIQSLLLKLFFCNLMHSHHFNIVILHF